MKLTIALSTVALLAGCEKAGPKASGDLSSSESDLLAHLPRDADFAFGGNFMKLQDTFTKGPFASFLAQAESLAPGLSKWTECFAGQDGLVMVGSVTGSTMEMRFIMKGIELGDLEKCAKLANFGVTIDDDKKFISIKQTGIIDQTLGYLVLPDGAIYGKQNMSIGFGFKSADSSRAVLEADMAAVAKDNALANSKLVALVEKTDRSKAIWFAGSADATKVGDKVGEIYGAVELDGGLGVDVMIQAKDTEFAKEAVDGLAEARKMSGMLGPEIASLLEEISLDRSGDTLRFRMNLSNKQMEKLMSLSSGLGTGLR